MLKGSPDTLSPPDTLAVRPLRGRGRRNRSGRPKGLSRRHLGGSHRLISSGIGLASEDGIGVGRPRRPADLEPEPVTMPRLESPAPNASLTRELRRLGWGLVIYSLLVVGIGLWALRLGLTHRRFKPLTVVPAGAEVVDSAGDSPSE